MGLLSDAADLARSSTNGHRPSRVLPHDLEAEESVLGAVLLGAVDPIRETGLEAGDFYRESHGLIYAAAAATTEAGVPADVHTVVDRLTRDGTLERAGGKPRIHELGAIVPATRNAPHYARIVIAKATLRRLIQTGDLIAQKGWDETGEPAERVQEAQQLAYQLHHGPADAGGPAVLAGDVLDSFRRMSELAEQGADIVGVPSGYHALDRITAGFDPGSYTVLAARPSMGKSALAHGIAANLAIRQGRPVALFSLETPRSQIVQRLLASVAQVDLGKIRAPGRGLSSDEWGRLASAADTVSKAPIHVDDTVNLTIADLRARLRRLQQRVPDLALVIVDYLGLIHVPDLARSDNRTLEVTRISTGLKAVARDHHLPLIALSQLNRAVEQRADKRPTLADLRDSGSIEQDADLVMFLYRDDYYNKESEQPGIVEINLAKNRNGPVENAALYFRKDIVQFTELIR